MAEEKNIRKSITEKRQRRKLLGTRLDLPPKKMTGPTFWFMVILALVKDALDVLFVMLALLGSITIVLSILFFLVSFFVSLLFGAIFLAYYFFSGVSFSTRKLGIIILFAIIELVPIVKVAPTATLHLIIVRMLENSAYAQKFGRINRVITRYA